MKKPLIFAISLFLIIAARGIASPIPLSDLTIKANPDTAKIIVYRWAPTEGNRGQKIIEGNGTVSISGEATRGLHGMVIDGSCEGYAGSHQSLFSPFPPQLKIQLTRPIKDVPPVITKLSGNSHPNAEGFYGFPWGTERVQVMQKYRDMKTYEVTQYDTVLSGISFSEITNGISALTYFLFSSDCLVMGMIRFGKDFILGCPSPHDQNEQIEKEYLVKTKLLVSQFGDPLIKKTSKNGERRLEGTFFRGYDIEERLWKTVESVVYAELGRTLDSHDIIFNEYSSVSYYSAPAFDSIREQNQKIPWETWKRF